MNTYRICLLLVIGSNLLFSQKRKYTMAEAVNGLRTNLAVKNVYQFAWLDGTKSFVEGTKDAYLVSEVQSMKKDTLVSLYQVNKGLSADQKLKSLPPLKFINDKKAYFTKDGKYFWLEKSLTGSWKISEWAAVGTEAANVTFLEDKSGIAYTVNNNLFISKNGKIAQVTNDTDENIVNGQAVHRNEFGIDKGIFAAPGSQKLAFYRMDQTMVKDYPVIDWSVTPAVNHNIKYPMAGQKSHEVQLGVYDIKTRQTIFLNIEGDKEQYLTAVTWTPDSKFIIVGVLDRSQKHLKMNQYDAATGNLVKTIFEEHNSKYVEPQKPLTFFPNSTKDFIWQSQRSGFNHLYHYHLDKGLVSQITKGEWLVNDVLGFNEKKKEIYFTANKETPLEKHLYRVSWNTFRTERLDRAPGMHTGVLNKDGTLLYDAYSNAETPRVVNIINTNTLKTTEIFSAANPLQAYDRPEIKNITLKAEDGTTLYGKLILPTEFDPAKKYPVIVYLYNGPHLQLVTNSFPASGNLWYEYMAQNGYIVFTMDGRGSANRGLKFEQAVHRHLGETEMADQMKGVEYLRSLPYVDTARMGIHGWSFGGFMTASFMLKHPEVFKVGVAGGPVIDWNMYEIMYTERYMDSPQQNPDGYRQANLLDKVQNLKGKLLMIHGAQDDVVVWQHSVKFIKTAVDNGVQLDYFVYPGHAHNVLGKDRVHLMQKVTDYFDEYLK